MYFISQFEEQVTVIQRHFLAFTQMSFIYSGVHANNDNNTLASSIPPHNLLFNTAYTITNTLFQQPTAC